MSASHSKPLLRPALALALTVAGGVAGGAAANWMSSADEARAATASPVPVDAVPLDRLTLAPLVQRVASAVVNIAVLQPSPYAQNPLLRDPYYR